jgi:hypothetical protein
MYFAERHIDTPLFLLSSSFKQRFMFLLIDTMILITLFYNSETICLRFTSRIPLLLYIVCELVWNELVFQYRLNMDQKILIIISLV